MARYRKVETRIWNDERFNSLSDDAKFLFLFLLTNPNLTALGAMRISVLGMAGELNWLEIKLRKALGKLLEKGMVKYDFKAFFLWLPNFLKYNSPESPNVVKSWKRSLDYLPECPLKKALIKAVKEFSESLTEGYRKALPEDFTEDFSEAFEETLTEDLQQGFAYQEQEQKQEQEQEQEKDIICAKPEFESLPEGLPETLIGIEIFLNTGELFQITHKCYEEWKILYPAVDVMQELRNICGWSLANPTRRKTKTGILKHINLWLSRAQNNSKIHYQNPHPNRFSSHSNSLFERNKNAAEQWLRESEVREKNDSSVNENLEKNIIDGEVIRET